MNKHEIEALMNNEVAMRISGSITESAMNLAIKPIPPDYGVFFVLNFDIEIYREYLKGRDDHSDLERVLGIMKTFHKAHGIGLLRNLGLVLDDSD